MRPHSHPVFTHFKADLSWAGKKIETRTSSMSFRAFTMRYLQALKMKYLHFELGFFPTTRFQKDTFKSLRESGNVCLLSGPFGKLLLERKHSSSTKHRCHRPKPSLETGNTSLFPIPERLFPPFLFHSIPCLPRIYMYEASLKG